MNHNQFLKNLRLKQNLTQEYVALRLCLTRQTYAQIEKGERDLTIPEASKVANLFDITLENFLRGTLDKEIEIKIKKVKSQSPVAIPADKVEKFKQVLLYILKEVGARPNIGETALYKLLYFIDFDYFERFGKKLIGATYIKNIHGPTPVEFKKVADEMKKSDQIEVVKSKYFQYEQRKYLPKKEPDLTIINAQEIKFIDEELEKLKCKNASDLSNYSHGDVPWAMTDEGRIIDYNLVWEREAPYTDHNYLEEFMQAGANDVLKNIGPIGKDEYEYYQSFENKFRYIGKNKKLYS